MSLSNDVPAGEGVFHDECEKLEAVAATAVKEAESEVRKHRWAKYVLGYPAVVFSATASASAFAGTPVVTAILALIAAVLTAMQQFQNAPAKEADHLNRAARSRHIARQVRYLRLLEVAAEPYKTRVGRLKELSQELEDVRGAAPPM